MSNQLWGSTLQAQLFFLGSEAALGVAVTHAVVSSLKGRKRRPTSSVFGTGSVDGQRESPFPKEQGQQPPLFIEHKPFGFPSCAISPPSTYLLSLYSVVSSLPNASQTREFSNKDLSWKHLYPPCPTQLCHISGAGQRQDGSHPRRVRAYMCKCVRSMTLRVPGHPR